MKTAYDVGKEYAESMDGEPCSPVDVDEMVTSSRDIPAEDYQYMRANGIDPDAREYWAGYNSVVSA